MNKDLVNRLKPVTVKKNHHQIILSPRVKNLTLRLGKTQNGYSRKVTREETLTKARKIGIAIEKTGVGIILVTNPSLPKRSRKIKREEISQVKMEAKYQMMIGHPRRTSNEELKMKVNLLSQNVPE